MNIFKEEVEETNVHFVKISIDELTQSIEYTSYNILHVHIHIQMHKLL